MARKTDTISIVKFDGRAISRLRARQTQDGIEILSNDILICTEETGPPERALEAFAKRHALAQDRVFAILPRQEVTTRILRLPTQDPREAANMVRLSAEEFVPYSLDEMIIDQCILDILESGESRVLAVLAHKDIVNRHIDTLSKAGIEPEQVLLSTMCLYAIVENAAPARERYALVDLAANGIEVMAVENGHLAYSRGVVSSQDWSLFAAETGATEPDESAASSQNVEATGFHALMADDTPPAPQNAGESLRVRRGEALGELAMEIRGSLSAYRRESEEGLGVDMLYLSSDWMAPSSAQAALAEELNREVGCADFAAGAATAGAEHLAALPAVSLGAMLIAFEKAPRRITLLPESLLSLRRLDEVKRIMMRAAVFLLAILLGLGAFQYQRVRVRENMIAELERKIAEVGPKARGVQAKQNQLNILRQQVEQNGSVIETLAAISEAAPERNINITSLSYDRKDGVNIWGRSRSRDSIHAFAQGLRGLASDQFKYFANARSLYEEEGNERNVAIFFYQIAIPQKNDEEKNAPTRAAIDK